MADYGAELQAQIAEKEKQKRLRRQNSLRESQQLMAQRMTVPSGLVSPGVLRLPCKCSAYKLLSCARCKLQVLLPSYESVRRSAC